MWIVRLALRRPYTFVIVALLIVLLGAVTIMRTPTDIFPDVAIPVVSVIWSLTGTTVADMEARIVTTTERAFTTSVNDIEQLFDYAQNFIRTQLATVQGASVTLPYGGKPRQVMVDLHPKALQAYGLSATDVVNAISAQNLILPSGTAKIGDTE